MSQRKLAPWRSLVRLREELRSGELSLAQFAADLHEVVLAEGKRPTYEDPARFFALTYPTHALRELAKDVALRLAGRSDKAVRQLELTYGGGKTHTLIALHHLFRDPASLPHISTVREFREHVGRPLPAAFVATLPFDKVDVDRGLEGVRGPAGERRTLRHPWSILAFQLGGNDGLRAIHGEGKAAERETPPAEPLLAKLLAAPQDRGLSTLVLLDEVMMYARVRAGHDPVWGDRLQNFFQYLVQAVVRVDRAALVASLLATEQEAIADEAGKRLIGRFSDVFRRQKEEGVQPVGKDDVAEVLRRQFFEAPALEHPDAWRDRVIAVVRELGRLDGETRKAGKAAENRFLKSFPFHPDLTEAFYGRWTQLERFQRTRGILRTLAIALREAERWKDPSPVIGPAALLAAPGSGSASDALSELAGVATTEETAGRRVEWKQLLETELRLARRAQRDLPALRRNRELEQAVVAVFLHSQPVGRKAHTPELRRLIGTGAPDGIELDKGLRRWRELSWFLDDDESGGEAPDELPKAWRLGNRPNLKQMHHHACRDRVSAADVAGRLVEEVRKHPLLTRGARAAGATVHRLPRSPRDLGDDASFRFAVLGPEAASESGKPSAAARRFLDETTGPARPRANRNAVVLAVPSRDGLAGARAAARELLGWEAVEAQLRGQTVEPAQRMRLGRNLREARRRLPDAVRQAWAVVVAVGTDNQSKAFRLKANDGPLFAQVEADERSRISRKPMNPEALLPDGPYALWREGESSRRVAELADAFARYPHLPRLLKPEVVRETVLNAVLEGVLVARRRRPDGTFQTFWREEVTPEAVRDPGLEAVLPERAALERLAERLLAPGELPGLWPESGEGVPLPEVLAYFEGGKTVPVPRGGWEEPVAIPGCPEEAVRSAVERAVAEGTVWLTSGPASVWKEEIPFGVLNEAAVLRPPPSPVEPADLAAATLPAAWSAEGATNGAKLLAALSQRRGTALPWGVVREGIRHAVQANWLEIASGRLDVPSDQAGTVSLRPKPDVAGESAPAAPLAAAGTELDDFQAQELFDAMEELLKAAAGHELTFRVGVRLAENTPAGTRTRVDDLLAHIHPDLKSD